MKQKRTKGEVHLQNILIDISNHISNTVIVVVLSGN